MSLIESSSLLFFDSFFAALALTMSNEMVAQLMTIIPGYNIYLVFVLALLGSVAGSVVNWQIGKCFLFLHKTNFFRNKSEEILKAQEKWQKFLIYILLFSWIAAIGGPFAILAGFFKTKLKQFLLLVLSGKFIFYFLLVFCKFDLLGW